MKLSTKSRYGLRAMIDLAVNATEGQVALNEIAERQNISLIYLGQVFSSLKKARLVKSVKGAQGGYILADKSEKIKAGDILRALEGHLSVIEEDNGLNGAAENDIQYCIRVNVWDRMTSQLNELVDSITLADMAEEYKAANGISGIMYFI